MRERDSRSIGGLPGGGSTGGQTDGGSARPPDTGLTGGLPDGGSACPADTGLTGGQTGGGSIGDQADGGSARPPDTGLTGGLPDRGSACPPDTGLAGDPPGGGSTGGLPDGGSACLPGGGGTGGLPGGGSACPPDTGLTGDPPGGSGSDPHCAGSVNGQKDASGSDPQDRRASGSLPAEAPSDGDRTRPPERGSTDRQDGGGAPRGACTRLLPDDSAIGRQGGGHSDSRPVDPGTRPPDAGGVMWLEPGVRLVLAPNPSPMTGRGTNTYLLGAGRVIVIDPGPALPAHLAAILRALGPHESIAAIFVTHSHADHSALAPALSAATGAPVLGFGGPDAGRSPQMAALAGGGPAQVEALGGGEGIDHAFRPDLRLADGARWALPDEGTTLAIRRGVPTGTPCDVPGGCAAGDMVGHPGGSAAGRRTGGLSDGVAGGAADGVAGDMVGHPGGSSAGRPTGGLPDGVAGGVADCVADGVADGVADCVADGVHDGSSADARGGVTHGAAGATPGGATPGGASSGGASSVGATLGGAPTGRATAGGTSTGGASSGGASSGGALPGDAPTGGATAGGASTSGASSRGASSGGAIRGATIPGPATTGGTSADGTTSGGASAGGASAGGASAGDTSTDPASERLHLTALHTPGHFGNHLCLAWGDVVFTGDLVMAATSTLISPPDGDVAQYRASLARLGLRTDRRYYPGHGDPVEAPAARIADLLTHRQKREDQILAALAPGPASVAELTARIYTDIPPVLQAAARRNVLAHLCDLVGRGLANATPDLHADAVFALA